MLRLVGIFLLTALIQNATAAPNNSFRSDGELEWTNNNPSARLWRITTDPDYAWNFTVDKRSTYKIIVDVPHGEEDKVFILANPKLPEGSKIDWYRKKGYALVSWTPKAKDMLVDTGEAATQRGFPLEFKLVSIDRGELYSRTSVMINITDSPGTFTITVPKKEIVMKPGERIEIPVSVSGDEVTMTSNFVAIDQDTYPMKGEIDITPFFNNPSGQYKVIYQAPKNASGETFQIRMIATDARGAKVTSAPISIRIDAPPGAVTIQNPMAVPTKPSATPATIPSDAPVAPPSSNEARSGPSDFTDQGIAVPKKRDASGASVNPPAPPRQVLPAPTLQPTPAAIGAAGSKQPPAQAPSPSSKPLNRLTPAKD
ncbi:hypothetical protein K2X30_12400 [bacterium]|jgi:hypothetical protein|nr:hypothetical protein [bacterium]